MFVVCGGKEKKESKRSPIFSKVATQPIFFLKDPMLFNPPHIVLPRRVCVVAPWLMWANYFFLKLTTIDFNNRLTLFLPLSVFFFPWFNLLFEKCQSLK